jgi:hypothetical protein
MKTKVDLKIKLTQIQTSKIKTNKKKTILNKIYSN